MVSLSNHKAKQRISRRATRAGFFVPALAAVLLMLGATAAAAQAPGASAPDPLPFCLTCHGAPGLARQPAVPDLAGQSLAYLEKQIGDFRRNSRAMLIERNDNYNTTGRRDHPDMHDFAGLLDDAPERFTLLSRLAKRACRQARPPKGASAPARIARCTSCHGVDANTPINATVPRLAGQSPAYLAAQMNAMRKAIPDSRLDSAFSLRREDALSSRREDALPGDNRASALTLRSHPIMNEQVATLTNADIQALADYLAQLPCG